MINDKALFEFVEPYYVDKDIMHNMWHIEFSQSGMSFHPPAHEHHAKSYLQ